MNDVDVAINQILKNGLRKYKFRNSKLKPVGSTEGNKGAIFGYRTKDHMKQGRGIVITSEEALSENIDHLTHWTPNVFCYGTYSDSGRQFPIGHEEENLRQINTFFVDIDLPENSTKFNHGEIVLAAYDRLGFMPTMILDTPKGYQAFFVLKSPAYVTKKTNYKVINRVAKKISKNIRKELAKDLPGIDVNCNHFGITRIPRTDNILFHEESYTYTFQEWMNWSMTISEDKKAEVIQFPHQKNEIRQIDEKWVDLLINSEKLIGSKGVLGRNNAIFTLSLAYYSSKSPIKTCEYNMIMLNDRLKNPLKESEIKRIIKSAYSSKYEAASKDYIRTNGSKISLLIWPLKAIRINRLSIQQRKRSAKKSEYQNDHSMQLLKS